MAAYLGKISAVIAANTQDFTRKLSTAKQDVEDFKRRLNGIRMNLDMSALDRTLTALQRMQRTFQEAKKLKIDTRDLQRMYKLFEDVGKPLTSVKNQIEGMSYAVQAQLYPALGKAQKGFQDLYNSVKAGGKASRAEVDALLAQVERLNASVSVVKGISGLNNSLSVASAGSTFVQSRAEDAMRKAAEARAAAGKLGGGVREDPFFQRLVGETAAAGNEITRLTAKVEKFKLALGNNPGLYASPKFMQSFADAQASLDGVVGRLEKLNAMSKGRVGNINLASELTDKAKEMLPAKDARRQQILQNYKDTIAGIAVGGGSYAEQKDDRAQAIAETRKALNADAFLEGPADRAKKLMERADKTKNPGLIADAENMRKLALETQKSADNTSQFTAKMQALVGVMDSFESKLQVTERSGKQFQMFIEAAGMKSDKLGAAATRAASDMRVVAQFKGNFPADRVTERGELGLKQEAAAKRIQSLLLAQQKVEANKAFTDERRVRAYQKIDQLILQQTKHLLEQTAALSGGAFDEKQVMAAADRAAKNAGSMGMGRFAGADLAFQQAAFAVDDFMSSTGGLEYKLRAVSNNLTQMGLMLGQSGLIPGLTATKGLFISLGVVMAGQLAVQLIKHLHLFGEYEKRGDVINEMLEKQRDRAKSAAEAFGQLAEAIRNSTMSESGGAGAGRRRDVAQATQKNRELLQERVAMQTPAIVENLAKQASLREEQKQNASNPAAVAGREKLIQDLKRQEILLRQGVASLRGPADPAGFLAEMQRRQIVASGDTSAAAVRFAGGANNPVAAARAAGIQANARAAAEAVRTQDFASPKEALDAMKRELTAASQAQRENETSGFIDPVSQAERDKIVSELEKAIAGLELQVDIDAFEMLSRAVYAAADDIESAQKRLTNAVEAGVPMARTLQLELDSLAESLDIALTEANRLRGEGDVQGALAAEERAKEIADRRGDVVDRARAVGRTATLQPLSFTSGILSAQAAAAETVTSKINASFNELNKQNLDDLRRQAGLTGLAADAQAAEEFNMQLMELAKNQLAATNASNEFAKAIERFATAVGNEVVSELDSESNRARRDRNKAQGAFAQAGGAGGAGRILGAAGRDLNDTLAVRGEAEARNRELQQRMERAREKFELGLLGAGGREDVDRARKIRELDEQAANANLGFDRQLKAKQDADRLRAEQRAAFENSPAAIAMRDEADRIDAGAQAGMADIERRKRGREMLLSDADKRREEVSSKALDLSAAVDEFAFGGERKKAAEQGAMNLAREVAPMLAGFGEEVMNARLAGPSRAPLNASDATTMEGQKELNRLLRGDDPSKDVNFVELQKQTQALEQIEKILAENAGVVVDLF